MSNETCLLRSSKDLKCGPGEETWHWVSICKKIESGGECYLGQSMIDRAASFGNGAAEGDTVVMLSKVMLQKVMLNVIESDSVQDAGVQGDGVQGDDVQGEGDT